MEERAFLQELCSTIMSVDKNIRFAGVINSEGKLLVGNYRKDIQAPMINSSPLGGSDRINSFRASYLSLSSLQRPFESFLGQLNYQLTDYDKVKLVTIPLTNRNDLYLCASIDPVKNCQEIIAKILKSI
jgi:hypothetical protein